MQIEATFFMSNLIAMLAVNIGNSAIKKRNGTGTVQYRESRLATIDFYLEHPKESYPEKLYPIAMSAVHYPDDEGMSGPPLPITHRASCIQGLPYCRY